MSNLIKTHTDLLLAANELNIYIKENNIRCAECCDTLPHITADCTLWGMLGIVIKCRSCGNATAAPGDTHIEAFDKALEIWNMRHIRSIPKDELDKIDLPTEAFSTLKKQSRERGSNVYR